MNPIYRNKIFLIFKKELDRFFGDRRMVISSLILPGILLYFVYAFLAPAMMDLIIGGDTDGKVYAIHTPDVIQVLFEYVGINLVQIHGDEIEDILSGISQGNGNFLLLFPIDFEEKIAAFEITSGKKAPEVRLYYNSVSDGFIYNFTRINAVLNVFERSVARKFDVNSSSGGDMADSDGMGRNFLASILPMFLLVFIYHAAIASTTEAITGEKERGTLSTILITPITPMELATGKIFGLGIQSFLCGISGTLGILLSLPRFIESLNVRFNIEQDFPTFLLGTIDISQYGILDIIALIATLFFSSLLVVTFIAIVSIHAKTAKEAQMILSPMVIIIMLVGLLSAFNNNEQTVVFYSFIPIYNSVQTIDDILNHRYTFVQVFGTIFSNAFFTLIGAITLSRLLENEKIMSTN